MEDKLILKGVSPDLDGEYACDIIGMLTVGHPNGLTNGEYHDIKKMTGLLASQLFDAIQEGDTDASVGLAATILRRSDVSFQENVLWDAQPGSMGFELKLAKEESVPPAAGVPESTPTENAERSGGGSSEPVSVPKAKSPSPTGDRPSDTSAISAQEISGI